MKILIFFLQIAFLQIFHFISIYSFRIIQTQYHYNGSFEIDFLSPNKTLFKTKISQQLNGSYINIENNPYFQDSITFRMITYQRNTDKAYITLTEYNEEGKNISLLSTPLNYYYLKSSFVYNYLSSITFAFSPQNDSFSIMHQLFKSDKILHLSYAFEPTNKDIGNLYLGGIPKSSLFLKYKSECKILNERWGCELNKIYFGNRNSTKQIYYNNNIKNKIALFNVAEKYIYAPKDFFTFLRETFLKKYFINKLCGYYYYFELAMITCKDLQEITESIPEFIYFVFEKQPYRLYTGNLFEKFENEQIVFKIVMSLFQKDEDAWIFGGVFFHHIISLFDYENKKVIFYPSLYIEPLKDDSMYYKIKIISILSIIISTFGVIYLSSSFFLRKKYKLNFTITNM